MDLRRGGEVGFLRALLGRHRAVMPAPPEGPGDDAALLDGVLLTADALLEGVHFLSGEPAFLVGRKAVSVNLSDVAAMGGAPRALLLTVGLPPGTPSSWVEAFTSGVASAAAEHSVTWAGGDTVRSRGGIAISVTVAGTKGRTLLTRRGARPGDGIYVTGPLGASAAGRALLRAGWRVRGPSGPRRWRSLPAPEAGRRLRRLAAPPRGSGIRRGSKEHVEAAELLAAHLDPAPRLGAGRFLSGRRLASAAIDVSDGLALDLHRLCEAGGVGALVHREAIPISQPVRVWAKRARWDLESLALGGGEDYELLFTAPRRAEAALMRWPLDDGTGPFLIGRIVPRRQGIRLALPSGRTLPLPPKGYDAFRTR